MQVVLVSFQNNSIDELNSPEDRILEVTRIPNFEVFSVNEKPQPTQNDVTDLYHALTCYLNIHRFRRCSQAPRENNLSLDHKR